MGPLDLRKPILSDLRAFGRVNRPARPWLGLFANDFDDKVVVMGVADRGPASRGGIQSGDVIHAVDGDAVSSLAEFYRRIWALGLAGVDVPLTVSHDGITFDVVLTSTDRAKLLKAPRLH